MSTVTRLLARWVEGLRYEDLPPEVIQAAKRFLTDAVGCAHGGAGQPDVATMGEVVRELAGAGPATVLVTGERLDPVSASLLNSLMIRVMDYNDIYWQQDPCHPSDLIPAVMACAERAGGSGRDLILGIVLAYELEQRLCEISFPGIRELGWHHATLTAVAAPLAAGRMLGLTAEQLQHAAGISASRHCTTGSVTAGKLTMMKNCVDPLAVQSGVLAALLAERGFTGPEHILDGKEGFAELIKTDWRWDGLVQGLGEEWRILKCSMKFFPTEALTHTPISATLDLVEEHHLRPEQVQSVTVHSLARAADILADPSKYDPRSKETADHSLPYVIAAAIADRQVTPLQFSEEKLVDPIIRGLLPRIKVVADPEIEAVFPQLQRVRVVIETVEGQRLERTLDYPKGDPRNPLSDDELSGKFEALARGVISAAHAAWIQQVLNQADDYEEVSELMSRLVAI